MKEIHPYPHILICDNDESEDCFAEHEHNPNPQFGAHVYGCECGGCIEWYRSLK